MESAVTPHLISGCFGRARPSPGIKEPTGGFVAARGFIATRIENRRLTYLMSDVVNDYLTPNYQSRAPTNCAQPTAVPTLRTHYLLLLIIQPGR